MNNSYSFIVGESYLNVTNMTTGNSVTITSGDQRFESVLALVKAEKYEEAERALDKKAAVQHIIASGSKSDIQVSLESGRVVYRYKGGDAAPVANAIVRRIIDMAESGFNINPMLRFLENLLSNPSATAIEELYLFLDACKLPITEDGHFIAYKIVKSDYMDIYTGKVSNKIGETPEMPRFEVDTNRNNTCSRGLHFCSKDYLNAYGSSKRETDRAMLVKINPADVVSIPSDYNNAKGRAWRYEVVGEVPNGWRGVLPKVDYTAAPVVSKVGTTVSQASEPEEVSVDARYFFSKKTGRWHDGKRNNAMVSRFFVANEHDTTEAEIRKLEV